MDDRLKELIAIGAAVGANCIPCLKYHITMAKDKGIDEEEIVETIAIAKMIKMVITPELLQSQGVN